MKGYGNDLGVEMSLVHRRVGREEVEVLLALGVPHIHPYPTKKKDHYYISP